MVPHVALITATSTARICPSEWPSCIASSHLSRIIRSHTILPLPCSRLSPSMYEWLHRSIDT